MSRRRDEWGAVITDLGREVLNAGGVLPAKPRVAASPRAKREGSAPRSARQRRVEIDDLLDRVEAAGGTLRVEQPSAELRAAYRRAISRAISQAEVPTGTVLRHSGRDANDLVIRLVRAAPASPLRLDPIWVPESLADVSAEVLQLIAERRPAVSDAQLPRATCIIEGLARECARRGHELGLPTSEKGHVRIEIDGYGYVLFMSEEQDYVDEYLPEAVAAKRYDWQRVSPERVHRPSGRLTIRDGEQPKGRSIQTWADRKRWTLESRLPSILEHLEGLAAHSRAAHERAERERLARRAEWAAAVPKARREYVLQLNRDRVKEQATAWQSATALRAYGDAIRGTAEHCDDPRLARRLQTWADWADREAAVADPLTNPESVGFLVPERIETSAIDKYMPRGMTATHPPDEAPPGGASWRR